MKPMTYAAKTASPGAAPSFLETEGSGDEELPTLVMKAGGNEPRNGACARVP